MFTSGGRWHAASGRCARCATLGVFDRLTDLWVVYVRKQTQSRRCSIDEGQRKDRSEEKYGALMRARDAELDGFLERRFHHRAGEERERVLGDGTVMARAV